MNFLADEGVDQQIVDRLRREGHVVRYVAELDPGISDTLQGELRRCVRIEASSMKKEARRLLDELPDDATWDDLMYKIYVRQAVEKGLEDSNAGRTVDVKKVRAKFGLLS